jgi:hypothetical protein
MSASKRVLTFDIGIRNLAWCLLGLESKRWNIVGWENFDLLAGTTSEEATRLPICITCGKRGTHTAGASVICKRHAPPNFPILADLSGNVYKTIPSLKFLRVLLGNSMKGRREEVVSRLSAKFAIPLILKKFVKKENSDLGNLHSRLQVFVDSRLEMFRTATHIFLENQPAFKNPTMKSLQILLFAVLRERLPGVEIGFVHASKKTKGVVSGDKGYAERKKASESRMQEWLEKETIDQKGTWIHFIGGQKKKSDLCDALCMCIDFLVRTESI